MQLTQTQAKDIESLFNKYEKNVQESPSTTHSTPNNSNSIAPGMTDQNQSEQHKSSESTDLHGIYTQEARLRMSMTEVIENFYNELAEGKSSCLQFTSLLVDRERGVFDSALAYQLIESIWPLVKIQLVNELKRYGGIDHVKIFSSTAQCRNQGYTCDVKTAIYYKDKSIDPEENELTMRKTPEFGWVISIEQ